MLPNGFKMHRFVLFLSWCRDPDDFLFIHYSWRPWPQWPSAWRRSLDVIVFHDSFFTISQRLSISTFPRGICPCRFPLRRETPWIRQSLLAWWAALSSRCPEWWSGCPQRSELWRVSCRSEMKIKLEIWRTSIKIISYQR